MESSSKTDRALRLCAWMMLACWTGLGLERPIGDGDESIHAEILRQMLRSGDYLHTRWYGVVLYERPPLMYWLAAPFARLWDCEVGIRMSSALMSFATLIVVYRLACRLWSRPGAALTGTILLAAAPSYHLYTRTLMNEAPYLLALTVALWGTIEAQHDRRGLLLAAAGLGAAVAVKSLAAALPILALAPWLALAQSKRRDLRTALCALTIFLALALPFFAFGLLSDPEQFVREHIGFHLLQRAQGGTLGIGGGFSAYAVSILYRDGPFIATLLAAGIVCGVFLGRRSEQRPLLILSCYALSFFVGMSCVGTHLPHYILPLYPAAMLACSGVLAHVSTRWTGLQRPVGRMAVPALACSVLLASLPYSGGRDVLFERPFGKVLGRKVRELGLSGRIFVYEWYGFSLGYYADRPIVLLTAQPARYRSINFPLGAIARANVAALVPPLPAAEGASIVIAGRANDLSRAGWFEITELLAAAPPFFLARAVVHAPRPPHAALQQRETSAGSASAELGRP